MRAAAALACDRLAGAVEAGLRSLLPPEPPAPRATAAGGGGGSGRTRPGSGGGGGLAEAPTTLLCALRWWLLVQLLWCASCLAARLFGDGT